MDLLKKHIDKQITFNKGKNLFFERLDNSMAFIPETGSLAESLIDVDKNTEEILLDYTVDKVLEEFCRVNQYFSFDSRGRIELKQIYSDLFQLIRTRNSEDFSDISKQHYSRLKQWLAHTNSFAEKMYQPGEINAKSVPCAEYSPALQVSLLHIDIDELMPPVLDIGCGKSGELVSFLREKGVEAYGIDRLISDNSFCSEADWLIFDYEADKWGSIISNLGFSNHFKHHHYRAGGDYILYAKKYMAILDSLKSGGQFYYAPGLPFIERYLSKDKFEIKRFETGIHDLKSVIIKKLN